METLVLLLLDIDDPAIIMVLVLRLEPVIKLGSTE